MTKAELETKIKILELENQVLQMKLLVAEQDALHVCPPPYYIPYPTTNPVEIWNDHSTGTTPNRGNYQITC